MNFQHFGRSVLGTSLGAGEIHLEGRVRVQQKADRIVASFGNILMRVTTFCVLVYSPVYFAGHTPGVMKAGRFQGLSLTFPGH